MIMEVGENSLGAVTPGETLGHFLMLCQCRNYTLYTFGVGSNETKQHWHGHLPKRERFTSHAQRESERERERERERESERARERAVLGTMGALPASPPSTGQKKLRVLNPS